ARLVVEPSLATRIPADDSPPGSKLRRREEAGAAVAHRQEPLTGDRCIKLKAEEDRRSLAEKAGDLDIVADHRAGHGKLAMERDRRIQQPVAGQALGLKVNAQVAAKKQVGLTGLDRNGRGDSPIFQIPSAGLNLVLGDNSPCLERPRCSLD